MIKVYPLKEVDTELLVKPGPKFVVYSLELGHPFATWNAPIMLNYIPHTHTSEFKVISLKLNSLWLPQKAREKIKTYLLFS
jgi:hypothetical protein